MVQWMERKRILLAVSEVLRLLGGLRLNVVMVGGRMSNISVSMSMRCWGVVIATEVCCRVCLNWSSELYMMNFSWL